MYESTNIMAPRQFPPARPPSPAETFEEPSPSESDDDAPPIILSPIKRRNARGPNSASIKKLSDIDVWRYSDAEIIGAWLCYPILIILSELI